jgi:DNA transformation protein
MSDAVNFLQEVFESFGHITARRMFGGYGVYFHGVMFGLYAAGRLYLKTDEKNLPQFIAERCEPYTYVQRGKIVKLSYWSAPDIMMDERDQAPVWARSAFDAALRAIAAKK